MLVLVNTAERKLLQIWIINWCQ